MRRGIPARAKLPRSAVQSWLRRKFWSHEHPLKPCGIGSLAPLSILKCRVVNLFAGIECDRIPDARDLNLRRGGSMRFKLSIAFFALVALPLTAASVPATQPETVGLSKERLQRIHDTMQRHM